LTAASAAKDLALAEARDDLRRDEAIFAEKMREIKALKREAKAVAKASVARNARDAERGPLAKASAETPERGTAPLSPSARPMDRRDPNDFDGVRNGNDEANARGTLPPLGGALPATPLSEPFGASSPSSLSETAELEKKSLVRQKAEIELERAQLRREAARRARAYQQEKKSLERQLRELARNIGSKEKLIVDLTRNEREANLLTRRYEDKVRSLEEEKASKEAEAARLRSELLAIERAAKAETNDRSGKSHENENDALRLAYEKKVRAAETELRALRLAKAQSDALLANTSTLVHSEADRVASDKTRELESEIAKMRADAQALRLRLREQNARDASFASSAPDATAAAELADLRREREFQSAKIEALASNETRHLEALRRATDELAAAKATIRRLGGGGENRALKDVGDAPARDADSEKLDAFFGADNQQKDVRALVEAETAKALARRERQEERARLNAKRDALLDEKRELFSRRDALLALGETVLRNEELRELRDAEDRADSVDAEVDFLDAKLLELDRLDGWMVKNETREEVLNRDDSNAENAATTIIEPCDDASDADDFVSLVKSMAPSAARLAAAAAMERVVNVGLAKNEAAAYAFRLEMQLGDAQRAIEEMEKESRMREMEFDRRVTELRLEHGRREAALLSLSEKASRAEEDDVGDAVTWKEDDAGSLAPEEDDRDDGFGLEEETRKMMHSLPTPPRLPATPVGVLRRENVLEAPRFAYPGSDASAPGRGDAGSIRKAAAA
jgi:hypothetical protein